MAGEAAYTDPEVQKAMELWKELVDAGYFVENANAYDWTDAADQVANGEAAMTLMGTWITGYWDGNKLKAGEDYDFFPFPTIDEGMPNAVVGPGGWLGHDGSLQAQARGREDAHVLPRPAGAGRLGAGPRRPGAQATR